VLKYGLIPEFVGRLDDAQEVKRPADAEKGEIYMI